MNKSHTTILRLKNAVSSPVGCHFWQKNSQISRRWQQYGKVGIAWVYLNYAARLADNSATVTNFAVPWHLRKENCKIPSLLNFCPFPQPR